VSAHLELLGPDLHDSIDRLIRRASLRRVHQRLAAPAGVTLDRSSYWLATWLSDADGLRLSDLAEALHTDLSTVSRQVQAAERSGFVKRRPDPSDGRASLVYLTSMGQEALDSVRAVQRAEILAAINEWSPEDQHTFARLMDRFSSAFLAWALEQDTPADVPPERRMSIASR
jgi:DNA-binding MarR family transcriptional regulator